MLVSTREPAIIRVELPFRRIQHVALRSRKEWPQKKICHNGSNIGIEQQATLPRSGESQCRAALEGTKDGGVRAALEQSLIRVLSEIQIVRVVVFRRAGEDSMVHLAIGRVDPSTEASGIDVRSETVEGLSWRPDPHGVCVRQWLRGRGV